MTRPEEIAKQLRDAAVDAYKRGWMNRDDLAEVLGVFPTAIDRMLTQDIWPIERSIDWLEALGHSVEVTVN